jgi:hypothetical protein
LINEVVAPGTTGADNISGYGLIDAVVEAAKEEATVRRI